MKAIANTYNYNKQSNVNQKISTVIITSISKQESLVSAWMSSTEVVNIGLPKLPLDDLEYLRHKIAELYGIKYLQFSVATLDIRACSHSYKGMLGKSTPLAACHGNRVRSYSYM